MNWLNGFRQATVCQQQLISPLICINNTDLADIVVKFIGIIGMRQFKYAGCLKTHDCSYSINIQIKSHAYCMV